MCAVSTKRRLYLSDIDAGSDSVVKAMTYKTYQMCLCSGPLGLLSILLIIHHHIFFIVIIFFLKRVRCRLYNCPDICPVIAPTRVLEHGAWFLPLSWSHRDREHDMLLTTTENGTQSPVKDELLSTRETTIKDLVKAISIWLEKK